MKKYEHFEDGGFVSVWIGQFRSADALDDYLNLSKEFENHFGFMLSDSNTPETVAEDKASPISDLIQGFSWSTRYKDSVVESAHRQGIFETSAMVVFFNFRYIQSEQQDCRTTPLQFLCAVPF